ncbi:MAG: MBL fold metallo-hydrolase [Spirochaetales bacterium]|nr:MBL fold metallo-hydrolase [Spirochaetales bacterium]
MIRFACFIVIIGILVCGCTGKSREPAIHVEKAAPAFQLYALRYGISKMASGYIFRGDKTNTRLDFHWLFYLLKYRDYILLIDTGTSDPSYIKSYGISFIPPLNLLNALKLNPEDITHIIITHCHFDHIGGIADYPDARIIIQEDELNAFYKKPFSRDIADWLRKNKQIFTFTEQYTLWDFITVKKIGGHTIGSSVVFIETGDEKILLAGDECYFPRNFLKDIPSAAVYNPEANGKFLDFLRQFEGKIYTFHDPGIVPDKTENPLELFISEPWKNRD